MIKVFLAKSVFVITENRAGQRTMKRLTDETEMHMEGIQDELAVYFDLVEQNAHCSPKMRKRFMKMFRGAVGDFLEENPAAGMQEICMTFGDPTDQHDITFDETEREYIEKIRRGRKTLMVICILEIVIARLLMMLLCTQQNASRKVFVRRLARLHLL